MMSKKLGKFAVTALAIGTMTSTLMSSAGFAATAYPTHAAGIYYNGSLTESLDDLTATDPWSNNATTFMPIWYVMQVLTNKLNIQSQWNGVTGQWHITTPTGMNIGSLPTVQANSGTGVKSLYVDGQLVETFPALAYKDPKSGVLTTFVPIYYVGKVLSMLGVSQQWDGNTGQWNLTYGQQPPVTGSVTPNGKYSAIAAFAKAIGLKPVSGSGSYSDFPSGNPDNGYVLAAIGKDYVQPDSSGKFGVNDAVSTSEFDQWFAHHFGINSNNIVNNPGSNFLSWGNITELNSGVGNTNQLSTGNINTMTSNIANIDRGYKQIGNGKYQLLAIPENETGSVTVAKIPLSAITTGYETTSTVMVSTQGGYLTVSLPTLPNSSWHWVVGGANASGTKFSSQYSTDNGGTWFSETGPTNNRGIGAVLVRVPLGNQIAFSQTYIDNASIPGVGISSNSSGIQQLDITI
jgi:hypothetical protein